MPRDKNKKSKDGKAGKSRKSEAGKSGGVKIPKPLRKAGREALKLASEPVVSEIVAAALLSAAAALRGDKGAAAKAGKGAAAAADAAGDAARRSSKIGDSLRTLAIDLAKRTLDNWERTASEAPSGKGASGKRKTGGGNGKAGASDG